MTGAELITNEIRPELVEVSEAYFDDDELLAWINAGERHFVGKTRCVEDSAQVSVTAGELSYPLPANWLASKVVFYNDVNVDGTANWKRLHPTNLEKLSQEHPNWLATDTAVRGVPERYMIWNQALWVNPAPVTTGRTVKLFYKAKPTKLASTAASLNVDDSLSDAIKYYVLWQAWKKEKEADLALEAREEYFRLVREGLQWVKKRSGDQVYILDARSTRSVQE